ncbi:MAG TPA: multicopper oxidase domain-containing protein [Bryobacteraceae bacterium]|nr:multicopper oxidase domain-containing protein [Bryobacteraceae bacterium]
MITRRLFLQGAIALARDTRAPELEPSTLVKFVDPLPVPPVLKKSRRYRVEMRQITAKLHRDLPPTPLWACGGSVPGPTIEARTGEPITVEWVNALPRRHFLPIDHTLHGAEAGKPEVRTVIHVHGAKAPPESDGWPEDWYTPGKSAAYSYPNRQDAAMLWYHDHAMGINRLNIYAGLFGLYILRDEFEDGLNLPAGRFEIPLVLADRFLLRDGSLEYPVSDHPGSPWVPEVFGNAMLVNGRLFPYLDVEPRKYRLRMLNASNGRFYQPSLSNDQKFFLIGTDQGLLPAPVEIPNFMFAPGERVDLVVDFRDHAGETILLRSGPFELMQFRVARGRVDDPSSLPRTLRPVEKILASSAIRTRTHVIREYMNRAGESMGMLLNGAHWAMPVTEDPLLDSTEIWSIVNPTDDSHPIHLHLVRFQLLDRQRFEGELFNLTGRVRLGGPLEPPEPSESGWKDTIRAHGNMITRFIVKFEGFPGRYVWHCHVLEHEDNEMMRPFVVRRS